MNQPNGQKYPWSVGPTRGWPSGLWGGGTLTFQEEEERELRLMILRYRPRDMRVGNVRSANLRAKVKKKTRHLWPQPNCRIDATKRAQLTREWLRRRESGGDEGSDDDGCSKRIPPVGTPRRTGRRGTRRTNLVSLFQAEPRVRPRVSTGVRVKLAS